MDEGLKAKSQPAPKEPAAAVPPTRYRRWDWRDFGLCVAAAAVLLWVAHFALAWDRLLVGAVLMGIAFGLGHWLGRRSAGGDDAGGLMQGRWGYRVFLLGAVLLLASLVELAGYGFAYWWPVEEGSEPRLAAFPWRNFVAGGFGLVIGTAMAVFGWRSSRPDAVAATKV